MHPDWKPLETAADLRARYLREGLWSDETLGDKLVRGVQAAPGLELRIWSDTRPFRSTVGDVLDRGLRAAGALAARGVRAGDVVAFQLPNWWEAAAVYWGAAALGAVVVPIVHFYGPKEVRFILEESRARVLVTVDAFGRNDHLAALDASCSDVDTLETVVVVGHDGERRDFGAGRLAFGDLDADPLPGPVPVDPDAPAVIGYTSGTTANPKGVVHSHRSVVGEVRQLRQMSTLDRTDLPPQPPGRSMLVGAPVGHMIGMQSALLVPVDRAHPVHMIDVWNPERVLAALLEADLTAGSGSTFFLQSLLDHPSFTPEHLAHIPGVGMGGSPVPSAFADRAEALGIRLMRSFGSTEHPSTTGSAPDAPREERNHTDGKALAGVELRLVDDDGRDVALGEAGEILSRGPDLFVGYTDPALTRAAVDRDGWYATGDVGVLDEAGCLTITDRKKDIIIRGGENVSAAEIEEQLLRMPGVAEVAVVAAPDPRLGEHACAFVRMQSPAAPPPDLAAVRAHLERAGLARQKWPEELRGVEGDFPRTPSGKVKKFVLRDRLRAEPR